MIDSKEAVIEVEAKDCYGAEIVAEAFYEGKKQGETRFKMTDGCTISTIKLDELHLWELGKGRLYDLTIKIIYNGKVTDEVKSYFGCARLLFDGMKFLLNGKSVFGRFVLDQGFYQDGIFTAPDTDRLIQDIKISMDMASTALACIRRFSSRSRFIIAIKWAIWCGTNIPAGDWIATALNA